MARRPLSVKIQPRDVARIEELLRSGVQPVRVVLRAVALWQLAQGTVAPQVARTIPLSAKAIRQIAHRYAGGGLSRALYDGERPGAKPLLDDAQKQRVISMALDKPPQGSARWTVRLVAEEAIRRKFAPRAGRETIRLVLRQAGWKPSRNQSPAPSGGPESAG